MPRFEPFRGVRYDLDRVALADVTAPPYDVIDAEERATLARRDPYNVVRLDLPEPEGDEDRYAVARRLFEEWQGDGGVLATDDDPCFYGYRMSYTDDAGRARQTTGVIGALELSPPGEAGVLPHEHTTPKARSDRLEMLRACRANLSAVWGLSLATGLTDRAAPGTEPLADWTDDDGVGHTLWAISDPAQIAVIGDAVATHPVVIADGHHRYETSLAYRDERRADGATAEAGHADLVMTYVVELAEDELTVRPIHRLLSGLPDGFDFASALDAFFETVGEGWIAAEESDRGGGGGGVLARMATEGALALIEPTGRYRLLRPRPDALEGADDLDTSRLDVALATLGPHELTYQHGVDQVARRVAGGDAQWGVLLRPATVAQIAENAHSGHKMPPKTTFFHPKPKTGLVFRNM